MAAPDEFYDTLIYERNMVHDRIASALEIVREFIADRKLLLVGGMAIDYALRLKGDRIYSDTQMPDYDMYSPNHVQDAADLGEMLCKRGFPEISIIQAAHITTMKVRVDFEVVADITYCPADVFKTLPFLTYENLRIIHPHYQMIDQHASLSAPWTMSGSQHVIFHRWVKDMKRYDKLYEYYPVVPEYVPEDNNQSDPGVTLDPTKNAPKKKYNIVGSADDVKCMSCARLPNDDGFGSFVDNLEDSRDYWWDGDQDDDHVIIGGSAPKRGYVRSNAREQKAREFELPMQSISLPLSAFDGGILCGWGAIDYEIDGDLIKLQIPQGEPISVASDDYKSFMAHHKLTNPIYYAEYFGKTTRRVVCQSSLINPHTGEPFQFEIFDTFGVKIGLFVGVGGRADNRVCNLQFVMLYLLVKIFTSPDARIVFTAEEQYVRCRVLVMAGSTPSAEVYGRYNYTHSFLNSRRMMREKIYGIKPDSSVPPLQPKNMFPRISTGCEVARGNFDPEKSEYFMTDGRQLQGFVEWCGWEESAFVEPPEAPSLQT